MYCFINDTYILFYQVETVAESPGENEALKKELSVLRSQIESLNTELTKSKSRHKIELESVERQNK